MPAIQRAVGARFTTAAACIEAALPRENYSFDLAVVSEVSAFNLV